MSAGLKQMKEHVSAVKNIKKITHSMKVVSAAKFAKSEKTLKLARPLGTGAKYFYSLSKFQEELNAPHFTCIAITSDRGLCGSVHGRVCRRIKSEVQKLKEKTHDIICVGEKSKGILQFELSRSISLVVNGVGHRAPTFKDASRIVHAALKNDAFKVANICHAKYKNMVSFEVDNVFLYSLPLLLSAKSLMRYEYEEDNTVLSFLEFSQCSIMYYTLCESYLVELSSRIMAMSNASKNASAMERKLQLAVNRKRQQMITTELIDIVSGAQVVVKK